MKKMMMIAAMMVATLTASAQNDDLKNEIGAFYGFASASNILSIYTEVFSFTNDDQGSFWGPVGVEYYYHATPGVAFGAVASIAGCKYGKDGDAKAKYIAVMPSVKFNWLRREYFGLYSALSAGAMFMHMSDTGSSSDSKTFFIWQATPIGLEVGSETFRCFLEGGLGEKGVLCAGLRYKF